MVSNRDLVRQRCERPMAPPSGTRNIIVWANTRYFGGCNGLTLSTFFNTLHIYPQKQTKKDAS